MPTEGELGLRARVLTLSQETRAEDSIVDVIVAMAQTIQEEGLFEEVVCENIERDILVQMRRDLSNMYPELPSPSGKCSKKTRLKDQYLAESSIDRPFPEYFFICVISRPFYAVFDFY